MTTFLLDAFLCLRSLGLLSAACDEPRDDATFVMTEYVARHELSQVSREIEALAARRSLRVEPVMVRSPAGRRWRKLRQEGVHKGEAEAIAWALEQPARDRPIFVSRDAHALKAAREHALDAIDVMGFVVEAVVLGILPRQTAEAALEPWEDKRHQLCRPRDFTTFEETFARRWAARRESG